jgi:hypothetical protein
MRIHARSATVMPADERTHTRVLAPVPAGDIGGPGAPTLCFNHHARHHKGKQMKNAPAALNDTAVAAKKVILFLDIDGVLHPEAHMPPPALTLAQLGQSLELQAQIVRAEVSVHAHRLLLVSTQEALVAVLQKNPHVDIVVSSAWRSWRSYNGMRASTSPTPAWDAANVDTLNWLRRLLDVRIAARIVGKTPCLGRQSTRLDEVRSYMRDADPMMYSGHWVALDDQRSHFASATTPAFYDDGAASLPQGAGAAAHEVVVIVDAATGLTERSARALHAAIRHASFDRRRAA